MEGLAPSHQFLVNLRLALENGQSLRMALRVAVQNPEGGFYSELRRWFTAEEQGQNIPIQHITTNIYRYSLFHVLAQGLRGQPIHQTICDLEQEWEQATQDDIERHLQRLPVLLLLPLLFLQFPAFLLLLLGPVLTELLSGLAT